MNPAGGERRPFGGRPGGFERRFHVSAAVTATLVVFAGFARSYYLGAAFGAPALSPLVHLHGLVMTLWFALFVTQTLLVAARRTDLHRRLGAAGAVLAALVLLIGVATAIAGARHGNSPGPPPLVFLAIPLGDMLVFAILVTAGLGMRRRVDAHRRLMLLACLGLLTPAIARIPLDVIRTGGPLVAFALTDLCVLACVAVDTARNRRLHPAFGWGALVIVASQPLRLAVAGTSAWLRFATWLAG